MKTMFVAAPFGRLGFGNYASGPMLGQDASTVAPVAASATGTGSTGDLLNVSQDIESLLKEVPPEALGTYQTQYKQCQDLLNKGGLVGLASGGQCLYDLYNKLQAAVKNKPPVKTASPIPFLAPQSSFPIVPVALAVIGAAALIYGFTKLD